MKEQIKIAGMSCHHCVMAVKKEISKLDIEKLEVSIGNAEVEFDENKVQLGTIKKAITVAGYSVVENK